MRHVLPRLFSVLFLLLPASVFAQVTANFTANVTSGCSPIVVQFTDASTGGATSWLWNLGNGTTSTLQNPSTTYITPGVYPVTLVASNGLSTSTKTVAGLINVIAPPTVTFTASDTVGGCAPKTVQFTSLVTPGTPGALTYFWDFGDGTTSSAANPNKVYNSLGNFTVTLLVTNASGCTNSLTKTAYIKTSSKPTPAFTYTGGTSCSLPASVAFTNNSTGAVSYSWNFGNGNTSTSISPTASYAAAGTYTVALVATGAGGCKDTFQQNISVASANLVANFTGPTAACVGSQVAFTNTSTPIPSSVIWRFGDGTTSTTLSPTKTYTAAGTYTVKLIANSGGCLDSTTKTISVQASPTASFSATPTSACTVPTTVTLTNTSSGATSYSWSFGDGTTGTTTSPSKTYTTFGSYGVTLTAIGSNGCSTTSSATTISLAAPTLSIGATAPNGTCVPALVQYTTNMSPAPAGTTYSWDFGDGSTGTGANPAHTYTTAGWFPVTCTATTPGGCTTTATFTAGLGSKPTTNFTGNPLVACTGTNITFSNSSTGATSYFWNFGTGGTSTAVSPTISYASPGIYTITLIATYNGCSDTMVKPAYVNISGPTAQFNDNFVCSNRLSHTFTNTSTGSTTYSWNFGDGSTSTSTSPSHTFAGPGTYIVTLTANNGTCFSVYARTLHLVNPTAQFSGSPVNICKGGTVNFTPQSTAGIQNMSWSYGDGTASGTVAPGPVSKTYATAGLYTVKLLINDSTGCADSVTKNAYVTVGGPTADFSASPTSGCVPANVAFTDASTTSGVAIASRIWTFGNGIVLTGNTTTPATTYGTVGTYSVKLVVTDANGCKDSITKAGLVSVVKPTAQFTTVDTFKCPGQQVAFINTSASATSYQWDFGDGTTSTTASPNKTYTTAGTYTVRLIATSAGGCKDTLTRTAYVKIAGGFASFTMSDSVATCPPLSVQFTNTSTQGAYYNWSFGNGTGSILTNPSSLYSLPGIYTVKLKTTNIIGCVDSMSKTVTVNGPYGTIAYSPLSGCAPLSVTLTVNAVNTVLYTYDLNNGVTQTTTSNTYTYSYPNGGLFLPKVVLSNGAGCNVAIVGVDTVKVNKLKTGFIASTQSVCQGTAMQFTDTSSGITLPIATRFWTFGDGTTSTVANPTKVYATAGTYTVKLKVTSGACTDSVTKTITVLPKPTQIVAGGSAICLGGSVNLVATGASTYVWSPSTGLSCTTCFNPVATPTTNTTYTVVGTATNGCSDTSQLTVTINPLPVLTASSAQTICAGASTTLSVSGASTYSWSPSTGLSCTSCASPVASPASTTTYTVTGTDGNGCASTKTVTVNVTPLPVLTTGGTASICVGGSTPLNVAGATTYSWTPATGLSCTTCANPTATPTATTTYIVTGTAQGCSSVANITVTVNPLPTVTATAAPANICLGSSTTLTGTGAASYSWSPSTGLSCATCASTVTSPVATTTYTVTGTSAAGCINTGQVTVTVSPIPAVTATVAQSSICAGSSTTLTASGSTSYSWSPATGLSCVNCSNPTASPATTTTYTVAGSSTAGCASTAQVTVTVKPAPPVTVNPSLAICRGLTAPLQASGAASYSWSPASTLSCSNCANPVASPATTTTYTVTGTGANGCTATASTTVTVNPLPVINAGSDRAICEKTSVPLQATGAQSYVWSPATGLSCTTCASPVATITTPVTYTIVGTDGNGCKDSTTLRLNIVPHIAVSVTPSDTICFGSSRRLEANGGQSYSWSPSIGLDNPTAGAPLASPAITTTYQVVIRENACYTDTLRTTLTVTPVPTVNAGPDQVIFAGSTAHIFGQVTVANQYLWTPADGLSCTACLTPDATPKKTTTYRLEARTGAGCVASDEVTITVRCDNSQIFIPNTFTPNGDGQNDRFYPRGKGLGEVLRFRVYDRWGEVVFEASNFPPNDNTYGWDGTFKGAILKPDTYVWIIETTCESGEILTQKGDISIVR